jgi:hypothetical protein
MAILTPATTVEARERRGLQVNQRRRWRLGGGGATNSKMSNLSLTCMYTVTIFCSKDIYSPAFIYFSDGKYSCIVSVILYRKKLINVGSPLGPINN